MQRLVFIYGQVASGKLTVARELAEVTGWPLFHNHLVVDAIGAVFPFGSEPFVRLREALWLQVIEEAARARISLIFTFAPEPTVDPGFPERVQSIVARAGGSTHFVALTVTAAEQERRLVEPSRGAFGKMTSLELLQSLREGFESCFARMPIPDLTIDTTSTDPRAVAFKIRERVSD
jgi:chloramphenicol 3-O-phosphotransferase